MPLDLPEPWGRFLRDLDARLRTPVALHCLGGFVVTALHGFPRPTADIDIVSVVPGDALTGLLEIAGESSELHARHGVYLDVATVAVCPDHYEERLIELLPRSWTLLRVFALDPYDLVLAKLERNLQRDRDDVMYLAHAVPLDVQVLRGRYQTELRPYLGRPEREDLTLELWVEMILEGRSA
jgi:hypothetical protein